jgi:glycosyltransferase involved in cell wall biosynthesis
LYFAILDALLLTTLKLKKIIFVKCKKHENKISIVSQTLAGGGAERVAVNLANYYASVGFDVDLLVFHLTGPYESLVANNVNIVNLNSSRARYSLFKLRKYLKKNPKALFLSVIRDVSVFLGLASIGIEQKHITFREANTLNSVQNQSWLKRVLYKFLMRVSYSQAKSIIANSHDTKQDLILNNITTSEKIKVIRNPVLTSNVEELSQDAVAEEWFSQKKIKVILSVGRLNPQKNFPFLISAFKDVYKNCVDARLMIVGEGEEKQKLLDLIRDEDLSDVVKLVEFQKNIYPFYRSSAVFALSSDWEGFGNVIVEALSFGLPVVSTNCPGGPKMILTNEAYGKLVPVGNKKAYGNALMDALVNSAKRLESIEYAKTFSVENVANDYLEELKSNVDEKRP